MFCTGAICAFILLVVIRVNQVRSDRSQATQDYRTSVIRLSTKTGMDFSWLNRSRQYKHGHILVDVSESGDIAGINYVNKFGNRYTVLLRPTDSGAGSSILVWDQHSNGIRIEDSDADGGLDSLIHTSREATNIVSITARSFPNAEEMTRINSEK